MDIIPKQQKTAELAGDIKSRGISLAGEESQWVFLRDKKVILALIAFLLCLAVFGGLKAYNYFYIVRQVEQLAQEASALENSQNSPENLAFIKKMSDIEKAQQILEKLKNSHIYSSLFFEALEGVTLPQVKWSSWSVSTEEGKADMRGAAQSYSFLANQITAFEKAKFEIGVSGINFTKNGIEFSANIKFDPRTLIKEK
ncbi:MAG: hypothetical protein V1845_00730 [bacterium]